MSEQPRIDEREVGDLIAAAGPRPPVPAEEVARIKAASFEHWRQVVERNRRQRRERRRRAGVALAASALLAVAVAWWWLGRVVPARDSVVAGVELLSGTVRTLDGIELAEGGELRVGTAIQTSGWSDGSPAAAALRLGGGQSLRLASDTTVRLLSERGLELQRGAVYIDSDAQAVGGVEVITALGTVRDIGTQFEVRLSESDGALRVRVREGECSVDGPAGSHRALRGEQLSLLADGSTSRARVEAYGPEWEWVMAAAPSIQIEGLALGEFLAWATRETGREVRYLTPELERAAASEITVHGAIDGLTPEQALDLVLRGTGLTHRVENGTILITR